VIPNTLASPRTRFFNPSSYRATFVALCPSGAAEGEEEGDEGEEGGSAQSFGAMEATTGHLPPDDSLARVPSVEPRVTSFLPSFLRLPADEGDEEEEEEEEEGEPAAKRRK
jgi:hypothetical protein